MRDLNSIIAGAISILPVADKVTQTGGGVDLTGYLGASVIFAAGTITDGTFTPTIEESDDDGSSDAYAAVAAADLVGSLVAFTATIDERTNEVGYIGSKKWIRAVLTVSGSPGTGGPTAAIVIKGFPRTLPA